MLTQIYVSIWASLGHKELPVSLEVNAQGSSFPTARWPGRPGQVKLPVGQVDLDRFFFISYK